MAAKEKLRALKQTGERRLAHPTRELLAVHATVLAGFSGSLGWQYYLVLWIAPLLTLTSTLVFIRNVAEHVHHDEAQLEKYRRFRTIKAGRLERFFFAPMNFHYHAEHHFNPSVCFYQLPRLHKMICRQKAYRENVRTTNGFLRTFFVDACGSHQQRAESNPAPPTEKTEAS